MFMFVETVLIMYLIQEEGGQSPVHQEWAHYMTLLTKIAVMTLVKKDLLYLYVTLVDLREAKVRAERIDVERFS